MPEILRNSPPNYLTFRGAIRLAGTIREYWAARGYHVEPQVVRVEMGGDKPVYSVTSDLRNGLPVRRTAEASSPAPHETEISSW